MPLIRFKPGQVWRDRRGVSALEFAMLAPALIAFYFGLAEMTQAMMADRRAAHAASAVGDLVAQDTQVTNAEMTDIFSIASTILQPFPTSSLKMRVSSVTADSKGKTTVDWSDGQGMTALSKGATVTLPSGVIAAGQSVIMSETTYSYTSAVSIFIKAPITFNETYYLRPRLTDTVARTA